MSLRACACMCGRLADSHQISARALREAVCALFSTVHGSPVRKGVPTTGGGNGGARRPASFKALGPCQEGAVASADGIAASSGMAMAREAPALHGCSVQITEGRC